VGKFSEGDRLQGWKKIKVTHQGPPLGEMGIKIFINSGKKQGSNK